MYSVEESVFLQYFLEFADRIKGLKSDTSTLTPTSLDSTVQSHLLKTDASVTTAAASQAAPPAHGGAAALDAVAPLPVTIEQWLIATFTGAGRHLCEELVAAAELPSEASKACTIEGAGEKLAGRILQMRSTDNYKPFMLTDHSRYSVLGWLSPCRKKNLKAPPVGKTKIVPR